MAIPTGIRLRSADAHEPTHRFDYRGRHRYLVTLPAHGRSTPFADPAMVMRVRDALRDSGILHHFEVYAYCFLPGRLVMLIRGKEDAAEMKKFLAAFRQASGTPPAPEAGPPLWSKKYLERVLRKTEENRDIARTIFDLPAKEGLTRRGEEYPHMGSFVVVKKGGEDRPRAVDRPRKFGSPAGRKGYARSPRPRGNREGPPPRKTPR